MVELIWPSQCAGCGAWHDGRLCGHCRPAALHRVPVSAEGVRGVWALGGYDSGVGRALRVAKGAGDRQLMVRLAAHLARRAHPALRGARLDGIVPVPSHWSRRAQRGFSTSAVLAGALGRTLGVRVLPALAMARGPRQAVLGAGARSRNLRGRVRSRGLVSGRVLLVDDVVTTGATAEACARELLGGETEEVWLLALCAARGREV